jgi:serine/threonine-protein kinase RsbW
MTLPSDPRQLREARRFVARQALEAGLTPSQAHDLSVALSEVCSNVHRHAYRGRRDGRIDLRVTSDAEAVVVAVTHQGVPFDQDRYVAPDLTRPAESGYGLYLIARLVDEVSFDGEGLGGRVVLVKRRAPAGVRT